MAEENNMPLPNAGLVYNAIVVHFSEGCFGEGFFSIPEMLPIKSILKMSNQGIVINGLSRIKIGLWMEQMLESTDVQRVILLLQILGELSNSEEITLLSSTGYWDNLNDSDATRMNNIYNYILNNFTSEISLEDVAYQANMTPSAFCRYFKLRTKKTLIEFLNELRVNYACQLLEENRYSITQICFEAGFNNTANFNRRFKHLKGITPQQYRIVIQNTFQNNKGVGD